jgi:hypothetical protein
MAVFMTPPWGYPDAFEVSPWQAPAKPVEPLRPDFADDEALKTAFGIALGQGLDSFNAGASLFKTGEVAKALWVSVNWIKDPIVIGSRDSYLRTLKKQEKPLDKEELLAEVLSSARDAIEDKDRVAFFKLYSEIAGFTGPKVNVDASTNFNTNNFATIKLVKGEDAKPSIAPNIQSKIQNEEIPLPKLKLVSGVSR